ncbi:uncharacterized protein LJ206_001091 [Theristicus caerulescens]
MTVISHRYSFYIGLQLPHLPHESLTRLRAGAPKASTTTGASAQLMAQLLTPSSPPSPRSQTGARPRTRPPQGVAHKSERIQASSLPPLPVPRPCSPLCFPNRQRQPLPDAEGKRAAEAAAAAAAPRPCPACPRRGRRGAAPCAAPPLDRAGPGGGTSSSRCAASPPPAEASHLPVGGAAGPALRPGFSRLRPLPSGGGRRQGEERALPPASARGPGAAAPPSCALRSPAAPSRWGPHGWRRCRCRSGRGGHRPRGPAAARLPLWAAKRRGGARPGGRIRGASWPGWIFYRSQNGARSKPAQRPAAATAGPGLTSARRGGGGLSPGQAARGQRRAGERAGGGGGGGGGGEAQRRTEPPGTPRSLPPSLPRLPASTSSPSLPPSPPAPPSPSLRTGFARALRRPAPLPRRAAPLLPPPRASPRPPARDELLARPRRTLGGQLGFLFFFFFFFCRCSFVFLCDNGFRGGVRPERSSYPRMRKANTRVLQCNNGTQDRLLLAKDSQVCQALTTWKKFSVLGVASG